MFSRLVLLLTASGWLALADSTPDPGFRQAELLVAKGRFADAVTQYQALYQEALKSGVEDERVAQAASALGGIYIWLNRYEEAEALLKKACDIDRHLFGADSPQAARHSVTLAKLYTLQHKLPEASDILSRARPILERAYGPDDKALGPLFNELGLIYDAYGKLSRAADCYHRAIAIYEKLGESGQGLEAMVMVNLVLVLVDEGSVAEAADIGHRSLSLMERVYGPDHPFTARGLNSLGWAYQAQGRLEEAREMYERSLAIWNNAAGCVLEAAAVNASLGAIYTDLGYYSKAQALLEGSLTARERLLGPDNVELYGVLNNLGVLYARQKRWTEAGQVLERGVRIAQSANTSPARTAPLLINLAAVYFQEGRFRKQYYAKAEDLFRRVLAIQEERFGPDHIEVASALVSLAQTCAAEKNYREAKQLEGRAVAIRQAVLGPKHPDTVLALKQYTMLLHKSE